MPLMKASGRAVVPERAQNTQSLLPASVEEVIHSPGERLDSETRTRMGKLFHADLSSVRLHNDASAGHSARSIGALAYTFQEHVVIDRSRSLPGTRREKYVLAHELAHAIQQRSASGYRGIARSGSQLECEADTAARSALFNQPFELTHQSDQAMIQKVDITPESLEAADIDPKVAVASVDYVDNNIVDVGLREDRSGLSVTFKAVTLKYNDGSILDIPIDPSTLKPPNAAGMMQITHYRRHGASGKIVPVTWRGSSADLSAAPGIPEGSVFFAMDITPNVMHGFDAALVRRAFIFAGDLAVIWSAALAVSSAIQIFSATQAAAITGAARASAGVAGMTGAAARSAAVREAEQEAFDAAKKALIAELKASGASFTESDIVWIARDASRRVVWLEKGSATAGLQHIMTEHGADFASVGVNGESNVARLIQDTVTTKAPSRMLGRDGFVYRVVMGGAQRELRIVIGSNGFVVNAFPMSAVVP
jgi:hypothetical protein